MNTSNAKNKAKYRVVDAQPVQMGHVTLLQPLPISGLDQHSPFLLLHHIQFDGVEPGTDPLGVGPHPHRGFEPVSFLFEGGIHHRDSHGNEGILEPGDVQWMTAGRGVVHSERASKAFIEKGGAFHMVQLWVNLPKKHKMEQARYQDIKKADIPVVKVNDSSLRVVAGEYTGTKGPAATWSPVTAMEIDLNGKLDLDFPAGQNAMLYTLSGEAVLNGSEKLKREKWQSVELTVQHLTWREMPISWPCLESRSTSRSRSMAPL